MTRPRTILLAIGLGLALLTGTLLLALGARPHQSRLWTDGDAIRTAADTAPIREVLWRPADRLKGPGFGAADEYEPRYNADGTMVVFVRNRPGSNADLYMARWSPDGWSEPAPIDSINTEHDELGPELSRDGTSLYFYSDRPGGLGGYDLWVSHISGNSWGAPTNLGPSVNSQWNEYGPALDPSGDHLYFSSNRPHPGEPVIPGDSWSATVREHRTRHDYDLYVADLSSPQESAKPLELLNTAADEGSPAISPAGDFLYFASDRAGGLGGFDLYRTRMLRDGRFGAIENLGPSVNSAANDLDPALSSDGFRLTFSSDRTDSTTVPDNAPQTRGTDPHRYSLWTTTSREVYRDVELSQSGLLAALSKIWPWLLILLLSLIPLYLFYRLLQDDRWRRRFGRLSLLAQCLLISLLIHAGAASLFTIWKVGTGLINLAQHSGGTRVILSSSAPSGSVAGQVRASITDLPSQTPDLDNEQVTLATDPLESTPTATPLPALTAPLAPAPSITTSEPTERLAAQMPSTPSPSRTSSATVPPSIAPPPSTLESQPSSTLTELHDSAAPAIPSASGRSVQLDLPTLRAPSALAPTVSTQSPNERLAFAAPLTPDRSLNSSTTIPATAAPAQSVPEPQAGTTPTDLHQPASPGLSAPTDKPVQVNLPSLTVSTDTPTVSVDTPAPAVHDSPTLTNAAAPAPSHAHQGAPGIPTTRPAQPTQEPLANIDRGAELPKSLAPATPTPSAPATNRVDLPLENLASANSDHRTSPAPLSPTDLPTNTHTEHAAPRPTSLSGPAPSAIAAVPPALPSVTQPSTQHSDETQTPGTSIAQAPLAPAPIAAPTSPPAPTNTVQINPPKRSSSAKDPAPTLGLLSEVQPPPDHDASPRATSPTLTKSPSTPPSQIPVGIPVPLETFAQRAPESRSKLVEKMGGSNQTEHAVALALDWFLHHQSQDGHWSADHYDDDCHQCPGSAEFKADTAMTGMALLCYLGAGHTHQQDGPYRDAVNKGLQWLIQRQAADGDLRQGETMYGQTVASVALCEAFAMTRDPALAEPARKAVDFVLTRAATAHPASDRDTSVLGWLVFTVESARRAGFTVPQATFDAARRWLTTVSTPASPGAYAYTRGGAASPAMTAEAMFVQQLLGHTRDEALMKQSARFVLATPPKWQEGAPTYYWYYATLALFQHQGDTWKQWNDQLVAELLAHQEQTGRASGSWDTTDPWSRMGGRVYQTAVCTLSLEVYYRYKAE